MPNAEPEKFRWRCPECRRAFLISKTRQPPKVCPDCRQAAEEVSLPNNGDIDSPPASEVQQFPIVINTSLAVVSDKVDARNKFTPRVIALACAAGLMASVCLGKAFISNFSSRTESVASSPQANQLPLPLPTDAEIYAATKPWVLDYLKAPKTAEFPETAVVKDCGKLAWTVSSYVDAKNPFGVPLRLKWEAWVQFNQEADNFSLITLKLNEELVYANEPMQKLFKALATPDPAQRRKAGDWKSVREFSGSGSTGTETFKTSHDSFRLTWKPSPGEVFFSAMLYDKSGELKELVANTAEPDNGQSLVYVEPGEYYFKISAAKRWTIHIEE